MNNTSVATGATLTPGKPDPSCAGFCVKVDRAEVAVGQPVTGVISWRAAPRNSVLSLSLDRADDRRHTIKNAKSKEFRATGMLETRFDGSLLTAPPPIQGDGSVRFAWSGDGFGCYRTEIPEICPGTAVPGPHVIAVTVMDRTTLVHPFAHPDTVRKARPRTVVSGRSRTFNVR